MLQSRKRVIGVVLLSAVALPAFGQTAPQNAGLPRLGEITPLSDTGPVRNVELFIEQSYSNAVNVNQPTRLDQKSWQTSIGIDADIGDWAFAGITGTYSREDIASTNLAFGMPMAGTASVLGVDGVVGIKPVEFLHLGATAGFGSASASYTFTGLGFAVPSTPGNSTTRRLGAFMTAFYQLDRVVLSANATLLDTRTFVDYGAGNIPQTDDYGATLLLGRLGVAYGFTDEWTVSSGVTLNSVLGQDISAAQTGLDPSWVTLDVGTEYAITPQFRVNARAATWLFNDRMTFNRVSVGASYSF